MLALTKSTVLSLIAGMSFFGVAAKAHADETRVRQAGQNTVVRASGGYLEFSASGFANHRVTAPFVNATVGQIAASPWMYGVWDVVYHSGGQFSLRFFVPMSSAYSGHTIRVLNASGAVIDSDPITY